jgi:hypothetical protein
VLFPSCLQPDVKIVKKENVRVKEYFDNHYENGRPPYSPGQFETRESKPSIVDDNGQHLQGWAQGAGSHLFYQARARPIAVGKRKKKRLLAGTFPSLVVVNMLEAVLEPHH